MPDSLHAPVLDDDELRPTHLVVDLDALASNYHTIRAHVAPAKVMCVLKANAYGHGLLHVGRLYDRLGAELLGVAYLEEAVALRRAGVKADILVLGGLIGSQVPRFIEHDLLLTASSVDKLEGIDAAAAAMGRTARVHLKIDTGMERIGVHWYSAKPLLEASLRCRNVSVEGVFSHLANADAPSLDHARLQLERFLEVLRFYEDRSLPTPMRHLANSAAVMRLPESWLDLVRPGILLYGVRPDASLPLNVAVRPALRWTSRVVYFKVVLAGNPVSYGSIWAPEHNTRVLTVPVGYGDGYFRAMSGKAEVLVRGQRRPVVGRICMDQILVNLGDGEAYNGEEVVLLGGEGENAITAEEMAVWAGTIPYEILTAINTRVPRVTVGGPA